MVNDVMKKCAICGKGSMMTMRRKLLRGHYNPTTKKRKYPNLQKVKLPPEIARKYGLPISKRVLICTKCIKKLYKD